MSSGSLLLLYGCVVRFIFTHPPALPWDCHIHPENPEPVQSQFPPTAATRYLSHSTVKATYAPPVTYTNMLTPLERPLTIGDVRVMFMTRS